MFYVFYGEYGELFGEYETAEQAEKACAWIERNWECDYWVTNYLEDEGEFDEDCDCDCDLEMGFDPYEGCYSFDC